jgi:hypothetical protein
LLQPGAPEGLSFTRAVKIERSDASISKVVDTTAYVAALPWSALRDRGFSCDEQVCAAVAAKRAEGPLTVIRRSEERGALARRIDVSAFLTHVDVGAGADRVAEAGIAGELLPVRFETRVTPKGTCKPAEVVAALLGEGMPARLVRVAQWLTLAHAERVAPMQIDRLRAAERERAVEQPPSQAAEG